MWIGRYELTLASPPCDPGSERWSAFAKMDRDVSAALRYLNATLQGAIYDHNAQVLTWHTGGHMVCFRPHEIAVSNLEDRDHAEEVAKRIVQLVSETWEQRERIEPSVVRREPPKVLDVYKLLPGENCKACGQPTCFTFALELAAGQADIGSCPPLYTDEYRSKRERLLEMLEAAGAAAAQDAEA